MKTRKGGDGEVSHLKSWMLYLVFSILFPHSITGVHVHEGLGDYDGIGSSACSTKDIVINQGPTSPLWNGIPTYTVEIFNVCVSGCSIGGIHVSCGWFSSATLVDPTVFRRLSYDDCLVNDGDPLDAGHSLSFQYANSFSYPLSVSSVGCF